MQSRTILTAAAATAVAAGVALTPVVASAHTNAAAAKKHVYSFTALIKGELAFSQTSGGQAETDVNAKGKAVGYDMASYSYNPTTGKAAITVVVLTSSGYLYGAATEPGQTAVTKGVITGGTGALKGAKGTFVAKTLNKAGTKTAVTITYSL